MVPAARAAAGEFFNGLLNIPIFIALKNTVICTVKSERVFGSIGDAASRPR
jgi:hypothetical protein